MVKRILYSIKALLLSLIVMAGCNNDTSPLGAGLIIGSQFDVSIVDSIGLRVSTTMYDSFPTSSSYGVAATGRFLVGHHDDPQLGPITASTVFQLSPPFFFNLDRFQTEYTSLSMFLLQDGYHFYDSTQSMTLYLYRVTQPINYYYGYKYNIDKYSVDPSSLLGSVTFQPRPKMKDSVEIFLPDALGQQIMEMVKNNDQLLSSSDQFAKFIYGFALVSDTTQNTTILGFKPSPVLRLNYKDHTVTPGAKEDKRLLFSLTTANQFYIKYYGDRSGTKLAGLKTSHDYIPSEQTDNTAYTQAGNAIGFRVEIPYVRNLTYLRENFQATRAVLKMVPVWDGDDAQTPLPTTLTGDLIDRNGTTLASAYVTGYLSTDPLGLRFYNFDVTDYINGEVLSSATYVNSLLVKIPGTDFANTANRLYIGDQSSYHFQMKLSIYYITLSEQ